MSFYTPKLILGQNAGIAMNVKKTNDYYGTYM
jgi:hypothetical protein